MLFSRSIAALVVASCVSAAPSLHKRGPSGFDYGNDVVRGVNIGGWLVLEPWITPSIFQEFNGSVVDEYTLGEALGQEQAYEQVYKNHWNTWCTWQDFKKIADSGFNVVRIPIGFWAYDNSGTPYTSGAAVYIDAAVDWARSVGLKIIIDLHGAPGSQNCFDNSGHRCSKIEWTTGDTIQRTLSVLNTIQTKYGASSYDDVIAGIELLNEPLTPDLDLDTVKQFERNGYGQQRAVSESRVVVIQDGFQPTYVYNGWLTPSDDNSQNVVLDHHEYQVFTDALVAMQPYQHFEYVCSNAHVYDGADKWTIVGEWSGAMTDCAAALNGYGIGARYDGTYPGSTYVGSCANVNYIDTWDQQFRDNTRQYIETQMEVFERATRGWIFWNFKTEGSPEWDAFRLIDAGIFPQPLSDRKFGAICS